MVASGHCGLPVSGGDLMASLVLGAVGAAIGGAGAAFTVAGTAVTWGQILGAAGTAVGSAVDSMLVAALMPSQTQNGARLSDLRVTSATEGAVIPRVVGRMRVGGNVIWATDFVEHVHADRVGGKGGGGQKVRTYSYTASFAVALCEGPIVGITRIWVDGKPFWLSEPGMRVYRGTEDQAPDPYILAMSGWAAPAYRGLAYVVFVDMDLERFGNRLPQISFEVIRPPEDASAAEALIRAVTMIPGCGEYAYGTTPVVTTEAGVTTVENQHASQDKTDLVVSLDDLEAVLPGCGSVTLVAGWFGSDLRCGSCLIQPGVEAAAKPVSQDWAVNGVTRGGAHLVSTASGLPAYGGTPSDHTIVAAVQEIKARGMKVVFCPMVLMDVPAGNSLPDPYSDGAAGTGQPAYPWRGRITCSPAAGFVGSVDKTGAAATQVAAFFGAAVAGDLAVAGEVVSWIGGVDWGYRRMVLHYAALCAAAGGVDAFLIGSELRGLTQVRSAAATYPAVAALQALAADVSAILGPGVKVGYAADWTEYSGHQPADGTGDVFFHLDPLWADANIDFVGVDMYAPLSDWRDGVDHLDAADWPSIQSPGYLEANIEGGEGYDWYYADDAGRDAQTRLPITDGAYGEPWVFRPKDLRNWWLNQHFNRPAGVQSGIATAWVPQGKPIWLTETGCAAVDKGANDPAAFGDPKSSESRLPPYSRGGPDNAMQRRYIEAVLGYWGDTAINPASSVYAGRMIDTTQIALWTWDARPFPAFPALAGIWGDTGSWRTGHWLTGRLGGGNLGAVVRELCLRSGLSADRIDTSALSGVLNGYAITGLDSARGAIEPLRRFFGFDAVESEGVIRFVSRGSGPVLELSADDLVAPDDGGEVFTLTRAQETELALARKWRVIDADADYNGLTVEARRVSVDTSRIVDEGFDIAAPGYVADREVRRALFEEWAGRETASFRLPPSRLAIDAADVIGLQHDGRVMTLAVAQVADGDRRTVDGVRRDPAIYGLPIGVGRPVVTTGPVVRGPALATLLNLPQLSEAHDARAAYAAIYAAPWWPGVAVQWSREADSWTTVATGAAPARFGSLVDPLSAGPVGRLDHGGALVVDLSSGTFESVSDAALFGGANALAVESAAGVWEVLQFGMAELVSPGRWRLTRLLRGQLGTEDAMGAPTAAGSVVVVLDDSLVDVVFSVVDLGADIGWRVLPTEALPGDPAITPVSFGHSLRGLRPFSPAQLRGTRAGSGDWALSWLRRSRDPAADNWALVEVPLPEPSEAYRVEILSGLTVVRAVDVSAATVWTYAAAAQTADFGAPVASLTWRVAQYGQLGLGPWSTITV
jgi:hypothetical protein